MDSSRPPRPRDARSSTSRSRRGRATADTRRTGTGSGPVPVFGLCLGLSWVFWLPAAALDADPATLLARGLLYAGGLGPLLATLLFLRTRHGPGERREFWLRLVDVRRIGAPWLAIALALPAALFAAAAGLDALLTADTFSEALGLRLPDSPVGLLPLALFLLLFGPLPEEVAWRGYALQRLQRDRTALEASLLVGAVWALWHLPLFLIEGTYQHGLGFGGVAFWLFLGVLLPLSVLLTWVVNNTRGSTAAAVLLHFSGNYVGELTTLRPAGAYLHVALTLLAATAVIVVWGATDLRRRGGRATLPGSPETPPAQPA